MIIILFYYFLLVLGLILIIGSVYFIISIFREGEFIENWEIVKLLGACLLGILLLVITLPSVKSMLTKDFDVVSGECTIELSGSGRGQTSSIFNMVDTEEQFYFDEVPPVDAYGKAVPYYCEVTVSKNHLWEIDYEIYDLKTRKRIEDDIEE